MAQSILYNAFIGIDVHKKTYSFTIKEANGKTVKKTMPSNNRLFQQYLNKRYNTNRILCAYETGPTGFSLYDQLKENNIECYIVSPLAIPRSINERVKNDRMDSERIADKLSKGELNSIRVPNNVYRGLRHLVRTYEQYISLRRKRSQQLKALVLQENLGYEPSNQNRYLSKEKISLLRNISCSQPIRIRLDKLLEDILYARKQIALVLHQIRSYIKELQELGFYVDLLRSIPGIGIVTATTVLAHIGDPKQLRKSKEIAQFFGLAPTEHSSGEKKHHGNISHAGNRYVRSLLIEAAWISIRKDTQLGHIYQRIKLRHHPSYAAKKAIVAIARKLTERIYRVLKDQRPYVVL